DPGRLGGRAGRSLRRPAGAARSCPRHHLLALVAPAHPHPPPSYHLVASSSSAARTTASCPFSCHVKLASVVVDHRGGTDATPRVRLAAAASGAAWHSSRGQRGRTSTLHSWRFPARDGYTSSYWLTRAHGVSGEKENRHGRRFRSASP